MRGAGPFDFTVAGSGSEARRLSAEMEYDLIVINAPLSDEDGGRSFDDPRHGYLLRHSAAEFCAENEDEVSSKAGGHGRDGAGQAARPRNVLDQALKMVTAAHRRMMGLKSENLQLQKQFDVIRLVASRQMRAD